MQLDSNTEFAAATAEKFLNDKGYKSKPLAIFLGGSRAAANRKYLTKTSDHDYLLIYPRINCPASLHIQHPNTGDSYDVILRDPNSLANYIIFEAQPAGLSTLLQIAATGMDGLKNW